MIIKKNSTEHLEVQKNTIETLENKIFKVSEMIADCLKNKGLVVW